MEWVWLFFINELGSGKGLDYSLEVRNLFVMVSDLFLGLKTILCEGVRLFSEKKLGSPLGMG